MFKTLEHFGFGKIFIDVIKLFCEDPNSDIVLTHGSS